MIAVHAVLKTWVHFECLNYCPPAPAPRQQSTMTDEQLAVVDHVRTGKQSLCVSSCAGSGKSLMIVEIMAMVMRNTPMHNLILVFNKVSGERGPCAAVCPCAVGCGSVGERKRSRDHLFLYRQLR